LRTPLTWIQGYTELLLGNAGSMSRDELCISLQCIKSGSDRLARLVEDAVLIIMLETGQAKEEFDIMARLEVNLIMQIEQVLDRMQPQARQHGVKLELQAPRRLLQPVILTPRFFSETLVRLVDNGIKFSRPNVESKVIVTVTDRQEDVEIAVGDNGTGIAADRLEHIFDPLVQVDRPYQEQQGVGLGLAVARGLVRLHNGRIWAESQVGQGTTVHFTLPHATAPS
jgi:signal transduction histidine kinase